MDDRVSRESSDDGQVVGGLKGVKVGGEDQAGGGTVRLDGDVQSGRCGLKGGLGCRGISNRCSKDGLIDLDVLGASLDEGADDLLVGNKKRRKEGLDLLSEGELLGSDRRESKEGDGTNDDGLSDDVQALLGEEEIFQRLVAANLELLSGIELGDNVVVLCLHNGSGIARTKGVSVLSGKANKF